MGGFASHSLVRRKSPELWKEASEIFTACILQPETHHDLETLTLRLLLGLLVSEVVRAAVL